MTAARFAVIGDTLTMDDGAGPVAVFQAWTHRYAPGVILTMSRTAVGGWTSSAPVPGDDAAAHLDAMAERLNAHGADLLVTL